MGFADDLRNSSSNITGREQQQRENKRIEADKIREAQIKELKEEAQFAIESIHSMCVPSSKNCKGYLFPICGYSERTRAVNSGKPYACQNMYPRKYPIYVSRGKMSELYAECGGCDPRYFIEVGDNDLPANTYLSVYKSKEYCDELKEYISTRASQEGFISVSVITTPVMLVSTCYKATGIFTSKYFDVTELTNKIAGYALLFDVSW